MDNQWSEIIFTGTDLDGSPILGERRYPAYACGHCTNIVVVAKPRERERTRCLKCGKLLCEKSEICLTHCTPMHAMASDHFEGAGEHGKYVTAIMRGITTLEKAHELQAEELVLRRNQ